MKKVLLFITLLIGSLSFGQTISINGSLHSTNGENTFPIWVEEGTTIQPNSPIKSISIKEFNVIPNSNGNDLVFNKTVLVYSDSVSTVPEGKTWKLESIQNGLQIGDEYAGGVVFYLDGNGGGKVFASREAYITDDWSTVNSYCDELEHNGYTDWSAPNTDDLRKISGYLNIYFHDGLNERRAWSNEESSSANGWALYIDLFTGVVSTGGQNNNHRIIPIRQF